jgi:phage I-like protein
MKRKRHCFHELNLFDGGPPEWIQLIPAGMKIKALDGRMFNNPRPEVVIKAFENDPRDVPIDWEHATEIKAPEGEEAPAAGWIKALEVRSGEIWARVDWTPRGDQMLRNKEYRYISPAFWTDKKNNVVEIISAGLTNRPALDLPQLASDNTNSGKGRTENASMNPELLALLGLDADASDKDVLKAVKQFKIDTETFRLKTEDLEKSLNVSKTELEGVRVELAKAKNAEPSMDAFIPRKDYDAVVARAETAESKLKENADTVLSEKIDLAIDQALKDGKITPATKDYYRKQCEKEGGLEMFAEFVKSAPTVGADSNLDKKPEDKTSAKPTKEQLQIARNCGISAEDFAKQLAV